MGAKNLFCAGMMMTSSSSIAFGLLDGIEGRLPFIATSVGVRLFEALGCAAFKTGCFSYVAREFPEHVATVFACLETFFGLGLLSGPTVGGLLFQVWGYPGPFFVLGSLLMACALTSLLILPMGGGDDLDEEADLEEEEKGTLCQVMRVPLVLVGAATIVCASMSIGLLVVGLEMHVRHFDISAVTVGEGSSIYYFCQRRS